LIGVAGLGYWGPNLARNFSELGALSWLCDLDEGLRETFAGRYPGARVTGSFEELLAADDVQGVVIATPVPTHYALAKQALEAGKHVLVEKPPAMRAAEIDELIDIAAERDLVLMPGHLLLYHPGVRKLKELIVAGELGETVRIRVTAKHRAEDDSQKGIAEWDSVAHSVLHPQLRHSTSNQAI